MTREPTGEPEDEFEPGWAWRLFDELMGRALVLAAVIVVLALALAAMWR